MSTWTPLTQSPIFGKQPNLHRILYLAFLLPIPIHQRGTKHYDTEKCPLANEPSLWISHTRRCRCKRTRWPHHLSDLQINPRLRQCDIGDQRSAGAVQRCLCRPLSRCSGDANLPKGPTN